MIASVFLTFVDLFVTLFTGLIFARVIMSYFVSPDNQLFGWLVSVTEPVLLPVRNLLPRSPMLDLAPLVTVFALQAFQWLVFNLVR